MRAKREAAAAAAAAIAGEIDASAIETGTAILGQASVAKMAVKHGATVVRRSTDGGDGGKPPLALAAAALQAPFTASVCVGAVCLAAAVGLQLWLDASLGDRPRKWPGTTRGARAVPQGRGDTATALL